MNLHFATSSLLLFHLINDSAFHVLAHGSSSAEMVRKWKLRRALEDINQIFSLVLRHFLHFFLLFFISAILQLLWCLFMFLNSCKLSFYVWIREKASMLGGGGGRQAKITILVCQCRQASSSSSQHESNLVRIFSSLKKIQWIAEQDSFKAKDKKVSQETSISSLSDFETIKNWQKNSSTLSQHCRFFLFFCISFSVIVMMSKRECEKLNFLEKFSSYSKIFSSSTWDDESPARVDIKVHT